ncbi:MAG: hypothetical protein QME12_04515 [Nanoarchaeota archaeon]|nr:hypothetical protein [Nanoarchaeota archaeon]
MLNKQGYIKTLEAVIAILIILIFTFAVMPKPEPSYKLPSSVENAQIYILEEIERNDAVRAAVMSGNPEDTADSMYGLIVDIVAANMPTGFAYTVGVCEKSACSFSVSEIPSNKSVYTAEAMIGSGGTADTPRIVRIWMWRK